MTTPTVDPEKAASSASSTGYIPFELEPREQVMPRGGSAGERHDLRSDSDLAPHERPDGVSVALASAQGSAVPFTLLEGDCRETLRGLPDASAQCCVTSPPYWNLRDYGHADQIGQEAKPDEYVASLVKVFREVRRVLATDGTLWLNLGDTYWKKQLVGIPWRVALALQADGWWLRSEIIWHKENAMPESTTDRPSRCHETIFLFGASETYRYDADAIKEPIQSDRAPSRKAKATGAGHSELRGGTPYDGNGTHRNRRTVWTVPTAPYPNAHFAVYPATLIAPCILAGSQPGEVVIDPFGGSGTTGATALTLGRKTILCELNPEYAKLIEQRTTTTFGLGL